MLRPFVHRLACLAGTAVLASCASAADVPSKWPVAAGSGDCHAIVGSYAPVGESASGYAPRLAGYFFPAAADPQIAARAYQADRFEIARDGTGALRVRALTGTQELASQTLQCDSGVARVAAAAKPAADSVASVDKLETSFLAAADGALLVRRSEGAGGLYGAVVMANLDETNWYRFARLAP